MNPNGGLRRATTMVPNLFTVTNMAMGFFAILSAMDGRWVAAASAIFIGHVLDILDGRMARWIGHSSPFGGEFDSFADWMSFGIAPGIMIYLLALKDYGKLGLALTFFFILCGALRLARFNLKAISPSEGAPSSNFTGLPTPAAGGFIAVLVLLIALSEAGQQGRTMTLLYRQVPLLRQGIPVIVFGIALLMISKVEYATFKKMHVFRPQSLRPLLMMVLVCCLIYAYPQNTIFIIYTSYILWGIVNTLFRAYKIRHSREGGNLGK